MKATAQIKLMMVVWGTLLVVLGLIIWHIWPQPHTCPLPSPTELQERLGVKADGIIGDETMEAWNEAYIEQSASKYMEPSVGEDDKLHFYDER